MLDHGQLGHGPVPKVAAIPEPLQEIAGKWGYLGG
jgi:hypothetical protein